MNIDVMVSKEKDYCPFITPVIIPVASSVMKGAAQSIAVAPIPCMKERCGIWSELKGKCSLKEVKEWTVKM